MAKNEKAKAAPKKEAKKAAPKKEATKYSLPKEFNVVKQKDKIMVCLKNGAPCTLSMSQEQFNALLEGIAKKDHNAIHVPHVLRRGRFLRLIGR